MLVNTETFTSNGDRTVYKLVISNHNTTCADTVVQYKSEDMIDFAVCLDDATFPHPRSPHHTRNKRTRRTFEGRERQLEPFEMAQAAATMGIQIAVARLRVPGLDHNGALPRVL